jgi:KDO2-lipid IV(A) lauroyltransferase
MYGQRAEENLIKVYGDELTAEERGRILDRVFGDMPAFLLECLGAHNQGSAYFEGRIEDRSARKMVAEVEANSERGWIGVTPHMGNWLLLATWASSLPGGRGPCHAIAKRQPNPHLSAIVDVAQRRMGFTPIYTDGTPMQVVAECLKILKKGKRLGIAPDQDSSQLPGVFVNFLGHPAYTPVGPAQLALAVDVPLLPMALIRRDEGLPFEVIHGDPIFPDQSRSRSREAETIRLTEAWSAAMEEMIHAHKEHWAWIHRRWRTTPEKLEARGQLRSSVIEQSHEA